MTDPNQLRDTDFEARLDALEVQNLEILRHLLDIKQALLEKQTSDEAGNLLTLHEVAREFKRSPDTITRWVNKKVLPARRVKVGKKLTWLFSRKDIDQFIDSDCY